MIIDSEKHKLSNRFCTFNVIKIKYETDLIDFLFHIYIVNGLNRNFLEV